MPKPINQFHALLVQKRLEILESLKDRGDIHIPGRAADPLDEALASSARVTAVQGINRQMALLKRVERAIHKIMNYEEFGICESCDDPIPETRLSVVPWAECCVSCQTDQEQKGNL